MEELIRRLAALLSVKSLVTLSLTVVFAMRAMTGQIGQDFMTIYAVIIAFYFGSQGRKALESDGNKKQEEKREE